MPVLVKNQNRFRKTYPGVRKTAVDQALYPSKVEAGTITLANQSSGTYSFSYSYNKAPAVTVSVQTGVGDGNVAAYVSAVSTTSVTIETSANVTGTVYVQVIEITG